MSICQRFVKDLSKICQRFVKNDTK